VTPFGFASDFCATSSNDRNHALLTFPTAANHLTQTRYETAEQKARRIVQEELDKLGWTEAELAKRAKGDARKIRIARRLRTETTMTLKWIANQLRTGAGAHVANRLYRARSNGDQLELV
jgi:hypothetical protein